MTLVGDELAILRPLAGATASSPPPRRAFVSEQTLTEPDTDADVDTTVDGTGPAADSQPEPAQATAGIGPAAVPERRRSSGRSRSVTRAGKASVRRIADKAQQVVDTDQDTRVLAADLTAARTAAIADLITAF